MNYQNRIALFVDLDNMLLDKQHIDRIISQLERSGEIAYAKFYGVSTKRHKEIIEDIAAMGFEMAPPANPKKRGSSKVFDNRILVDLCEIVFTNASVSSVAIVANPTNQVHLFAKLKKEDVGIYACDNLDDNSLAFVDEVLSFGYSDPNTAAKQKAAIAKEKKEQKQKDAKVAAAQEEKPAAPAVEAQPVAASPADSAEGYEEVREGLFVAEPASEEVSEAAPAEEAAPVEEAVASEEAAPAEETKAETPDLKIIKEIHDTMESEPSDDDKEDAELIEKIKKLLSEAEE